MVKEKDEEIVSLLREQLAQSSAVNAALLQQLVKMATPVAPDESDVARKRLNAAIDAERSRGTIGEERYPVTSEVGGVMLDGRLVSASFVLCVQQGRVVRMDRYELPPEASLHTSQGGVCAMPIENMYTKDSAGNSTTTPTNDHRKWTYDTFWLPDAHHYVGRPLPRHMRPAPVDGPSFTASAAAE